MRSRARAKIRSIPQDVQVTPLVATSTGWTGSNYSGGFNVHTSSGDATSLYTGPGTTLGIKTYRDDKLLWVNIERSSGNLDWLGAWAIKIESIIDAMAALGIRPIVILGADTAPWSHPSMFTDPATPPVEYQAYVTFVVNHLGSKCNDYDVYNEPNNNGKTAQQYAWALQNTYQKVKDANPNARVWGNMLDANTNATYRDALVTAGGFDYMDGFLTHVYEGGGSSTLTRTANWTRAKFRNAINVILASYPNMRFGAGECGWETNAVTEDVAGRFLAQQAFMFRAMQGVEIHNVYSLYDYSGSILLGLYDAGGIKDNAPYYKNAIAICQDTTAAKYYQDVPVHYVSLLRVGGNRNLALWGDTSAEPASGDTAASTDASGTKSVWVKNTQGPGTLIRTSMLDGSTTSQTLNPGTQQYSVAYSQVAAVLSSTNIIQFPECPV